MKIKSNGPENSKVSPLVISADPPPPKWAGDHFFVLFYFCTLPLLNHIINDISAIAQRGDLRVIKILFTKIEVIVISVVYWQ